jgi:LacI family transcriptional regulator, galactose operon repressor
MKKRVLLKDIANELGVSTTLVSYVLNDNKNVKVGAEIAKKIRETAKRLNYEPNYIARSLKSRKTQTIGLIVADISNPFFSNLARIIEDEAGKYNYTVIIGSSDENPEKLKKILNFFSIRLVDGFIVVPTVDSFEMINSLSINNVPFVLLDRSLDNISANCVVIDNFKASYLATQHLLKKGIKKVGLIAYDANLNHFNDRIQGYQEALKSYKIVPDKNLIKMIKYSDFREQIKLAVSDLVDNHKVESIYFTTNTLALEGLKYIFSLGMKIPEDIDIMAFDYSEVYNFFQYHIPHICQPTKEMGVEAVKLLIEQIEQDTKRIKKVYLDASLSLDFYCTNV